jgi:hypothetical protein
MAMQLLHHKGRAVTIAISVSYIHFFWSSLLKSRWVTLRFNVIIIVIQRDLPTAFILARTMSMQQNLSKSNAVMLLIARIKSTNYIPSK